MEDAMTRPRLQHSAGRARRPRARLAHRAFLEELRALLDRHHISGAGRCQEARRRRRCTAQAAPQETGSKPAAIRPAIRRVQTFVEEHAGEALSLDRLAQEAHLSKHHFARVFREQTGTTPWAYVREARLQRAKDLLRKDCPFAEVALRTGFYDQSHFTKIFKEAEGQTPGAYREERKDLQEDERSRE